MLGEAGCMECMECMECMHHECWKEAVGKKGASTSPVSSLMQASLEGVANASSWLQGEAPDACSISSAFFMLFDIF